MVSPADYSPYIWVDASDASTLYDATTGGSLVSDGGLVARIEDKSGNARHATQGTSGKRPLRIASAVFGNGAMDVAANDDYLSFGDLGNFGATDFAVLAAVNPTTSSSNVFLGKGISHPSGLFNNRGYYLQSNVPPSQPASAVFSQSGSYKYASAGANTSTGWQVFAFRRNSLSLSCYRNGVAGAATANVTFLATSFPLAIGAAYLDTASVSNFTGLIGEIIILPTAGTSEVDALNTYLHDKWVTGLSTGNPAGILQLNTQSMRFGL
jgi:hypothetical protein